MLKHLLIAAILGLFVSAGVASQAGAAPAVPGIANLDGTPAGGTGIVKTNGWWAVPVVIGGVVLLHHVHRRHRRVYRVHHHHHHYYPRRSRRRR